MGHRLYEAGTLTRLADTYQASGALEAARGAWQEAATILDELKHPTAEAVHAKLRGAVKTEA
jgi:hypothetical protein